MRGVAGKCAGSNNFFCRRIGVRNADIRWQIIVLQTVTREIIFRNLSKNPVNLSNFIENIIISIFRCPCFCGSDSSPGAFRFRPGRRTRRLCSRPLIRLHGKPPVLSYRLHPVRGKSLSRAARTIAQRRIPGRRANAGNCGRISGGEDCGLQGWAPVPVLTGETRLLRESSTLKEVVR